MIPPLRFEPIFKSALWGGRQLAGLFPHAPAGDRIAEAWLLSDLDHNISTVADGPLQGTSLRELMQTRRDELLGPDLAHHESFPLLFKVIDARELLSVQVHPNDEQAQRLEGQPRGKTEAWIILHAGPDARIYAGFKPGVDRLDFLRAMENGTVEETLHSFEPKAGDCLLMPPGTVHAVGGGVTIAEIQQSSDLTYRLFDWNRIDSRTGQPRELHVEKALECLDFERGPVGPVEVVAGSLVERLVECEYFDLRRIRLKQELLLDPSSCLVLVALDGSAAVESTATKEMITLKKGGAILVPPGQCRIDPHGLLTCLMCRFDWDARMLIDLNCDLGEGAANDAELLKLVTTANVACGFHAGDAETAHLTIAAAAASGIRTGAHPSFPDRDNFGRTEMKRSDRRVYEDCVYQIGALAALAASCDTKLTHVKPHGALYNQACRDAYYAEPIVAAASVFALPIMGLPNSQLQKLTGNRFIVEGFADRRYRPDGSLVPRSEPDAFVHDPAEAAKQALDLVRTHGVRTLCVHGDNPQGVELVRALRDALTANGFTIQAFA